jgi:hypothetical protein
VLSYSGQNLPEFGRIIDFAMELSWSLELLFLGSRRLQKYKPQTIFGSTKQCFYSKTKLFN